MGGLNCLENHYALESQIFVISEKSKFHLTHLTLCLTPFIITTLTILQWRIGSLAVVTENRPWFEIYYHLLPLFHPLYTHHLYMQWNLVRPILLFPSI